MIVRRAATWLAVSIGLTLACMPGAAAQPAGPAQQSSTAPGLSMDSDQPVRIESNTLEVRDKIRQATFAGDVKLTQGETIIKCRVLVVFYEDTAAPTKKAAPSATAGAPPPKSGQKIKRAEAKGDVFIIQKDQTASGDTGVFDIKSNTFVITGNVVVTRSDGAVLRGTRMVSNLTTGVTNVYSAPIASSGKGAADPPSAPSRVEMMLPGASKDAKASPAPAPTPPPASAPAPATPPPTAKAAPKGPMRLNN